MLSTRSRYLIGCEEAWVIRAYEHRAGEQITTTATATAIATTSTSSANAVVIITVPIGSATATASPTDEGGEVSYVHQFRGLLRDERGII